MDREQSLSQSQHDLDFLVSHWRLQRLALRDVLSELLAATMLDPSPMHDPGRLADFRTELLDYVCTGHFLIYRRLLEQHPVSRPDWCELRTVIYRHIGRSTDAVLRFNEQFETDDSSVKSQTLSRELGRLARGLLVRFALEEQLLVCETQTA